LALGSRSSAVNNKCMFQMGPMRGRNINIAKPTNPTAAVIDHLAHDMQANPQITVVCSSPRSLGLWPRSSTVGKPTDPDQPPRPASDLPSGKLSHFTTVSSNLHPPDSSSLTVATIMRSPCVPWTSRGSRAKGRITWTFPSWAGNIVILPNVGSTPRVSCAHRSTLPLALQTLRS
jgi:hypothetical protein